MNFGKTLRAACAAVAALVPFSLYAQATNPPLAPVPAYMVNPGVSGPVIANQPVVPPANGQFFVPDNFGGAPVMGPGGVCPPMCPPVCGPVCPQPCPPANFDPYYSPLPGGAAPVTTMPGGINWNTTTAGGAGITPRFGGGYLDGEHVGLTDGYIWLEGWVPVWQTPGQNVFFLDVNTLKYNDGHDQWGFNGHGGYRWFNCQTNRIWGGYLGYDYRDVGAAEYEQISGGIESLGALWDFRANAYYVFGNDTTQTAVSDPFFVGNNLAVNTTNLDAYSGFDVEAGRNFTPQNPSMALRGFIGGYGFFNENAEDVWGGRARLEARWWNRFTAEAGVNHDQTFDTTVWIAGSILFGGSQAHAAACGCPPTIVDRLADPIYKNRHIVVNERVEQELVLNPADGEPLFFLHIDSNNAAPGTGTFEDPFATLAAAEAANNAGVDILLAHGGSVFTDEQISLNFANQRFLGDGDAVGHTVDSQFGTLTLPRANGLAAQPVITGTSSGSSITVAAANVEVSGFEIVNPEDHGIFVNGVQGFNINRNSISGADANNGTVGEGIFVDVTGIAGATGTIDSNVVSGGNENGIRIESGAASFAGTVTNNQSVGNDLDGFNFDDVSGGNISGNLASGNGDDGFQFSTISGGTLADNTASGNGDNGFEIAAISGGTISGNSASGNADDGFAVAVISGGTFSGNTSTGNTSDGFELLTMSGGTVSGNSAFGNGADGFFFSAITGGLVDSNIASNNTDDGFDINVAFTGGQFNNNTANNNTDQGYEVTGAGGTATATNNGGTGNAGGDTFVFP